MKKIIFMPVPMKELKEDSKCDFSGKGNVNITCSEKIYFGINAVLGTEIKEGDEAEIVLIKTKTGNNDFSDKNCEFFTEEFNKLCGKKCSSVKIKKLEVNFTETKKDYEKLFNEMVKCLSENAEIYADTTFGPRMNMMIIMNVLNFAEKFYNADIKLLMNQKAHFNPESNMLVKGSQEVYDVSSFYFLNNIIVEMEASDADSAIDLMDHFFHL